MTETSSGPAGADALDPPELLWRPDPARVGDTAITRFREWVRDEWLPRSGAAADAVPMAEYHDLWQWSVTDVAGFWGALVEFLGVHFHAQPEQVLADDTMPGARWFPGATVNYAEHALREGPRKADDEIAVLFHREDGLRSRLTFGELRGQVAAMRAALLDLGVRNGDRVVALAPNCPQTLVAFLAAASIGATWSSCSPDFGVRAVADRFAQIEPAVLIAVDGYRYNGRAFDIRPTVEQLRGEIPGLRATVLVDYLGQGATLGPGPHPVLDWDALLAEHAGATPGFDPVPFDHPLWVLYSSGTTGLPKGIVHGHGGILVEHLKSAVLHCDFGPGDRFFWFTTTGWMMWNYLIGGLLSGATIVLFDGSPAFPDLSALWRLAEEHRITYFGTSAPYVQSCLKAELHPAERFDLTALRTVGSTGAPLTPEGFRWIGESVAAQGNSVQIASVSGGTDVCTAFVGSAPDVPVWLGELSCRSLGAAVTAFDEDGHEVHDTVGELVITRPMPSMPVSFWADPDGSRLREAYFETYPGIWRHGDWIRVTERGSCVIYGRSDSTLNRGGVRMGTSEFYRVVEGLDGVADSLVIDTSGTGRGDGELLCFLVLAEGVRLADVEPLLRKELRAQLSPRHVPDRFVAVADIPRTLNGKKCEVPVKKILAGTAPERAVSRDALSNPDALSPFVTLAGERGGAGAS